VDTETHNHKLRLLEIYKDNLRELELQAARFGANPPLNIINEIKHHRKNIDDIRLTLRTNADEVTFDKLLVNIEELRNFARDEVQRAFDIYGEIHRDDVARAWTGIFIFSGTALLIGGVVLLYQYIKGDFLPHNISFAITMGGAIIGFILAMSWGFREAQRQDVKLLQKFGFNPYKEQAENYIRLFPRFMIIYVVLFVLMLLLVLFVPVK
jgi:hypothetical protein